MKRRALLAVALELFPDKRREELYALILCGELLVDGERVRDPKLPVATGARLELAASPFVSRGGLKLELALAEWGIEVAGKVFIDAGASTGGFTDCLLRRGAAYVHAVDVGTNQLAYSLRRDPRVGVHEGTNLLALKKGSLDPSPDAAVADLSFRSIAGAASHLLSLVSEGWIIALVKPQFELAARSGGGALRGRSARLGGGLGEMGVTKETDPAGRFDGVVRDPELRVETLAAVERALVAEGALVERRIDSPIPGRKGNREQLFFIRRRSG